MAKAEPKLRQSLDILEINDSTWMNLGQLRALVKKADELNWDDSSLISHSSGRDHPSQRNMRIGGSIYIEGAPRK